MQIDARRPGGTYIDAGTKPKADDVAAMLSEGEFVITKDGMEGFDLQTGGPGDSRSGAKKMYAQMLEKKIMMFYDTLKWDVPVNKKTSLERFF